MKSGSFFFLFFHKDIILLTCTEFVMHTKSQKASNDTATYPVLPHDMGGNLKLKLNQKSLIPPNSTTGSFGASMQLHRPWSVNYCFCLSPFTTCILKLLSLPISLNSADSSILLGGSSVPSLSLPTFAVLLLRKMVEQGEKVHEFQY